MSPEKLINRVWHKVFHSFTVFVQYIQSTENLAYSNTKY